MMEAKEEAGGSEWAVGTCREEYPGDRLGRRAQWQL